MDLDYLHEFIDIDDITNILFGNPELEYNLKYKDDRLKNQLRSVLYNHHMKLTDVNIPLYEIQDNDIIRIPGAVILYISGSKYNNTITEQQNDNINIILHKYNLFISRVVIDNCETGHYKCKVSFNCPYQGQKCNITKDNCEIITNDGYQLGSCAKLGHHRSDHTHELKMFVPNIFLKKLLYLKHGNSAKIRLNKINNPMVELDKVKIMMEILPLFTSLTCLSDCTELFFIAKDNGCHHSTMEIDEIRNMIIESGLKKISAKFDLQNHINVPDVVIE